MIGQFSIGARRFRVDFSRPRTIAIPLDPHGPQPRFFCTEPANASPLRTGGFVGDVRLGGSCNAEQISLAPHCHGTHTECIGHLLPDAPAVQEAIAPGPGLALLVSLRDTGGPEPLIEPAEVERALDGAWMEGTEALVIRTLPNEAGKKRRDYDNAPYPVLAPDAMDLLASLPLKHLLIDTPSLDPAQDGGRLANHRCWWGLDGSGKGSPNRRQRSVTEMTFVPDDVPDGLYWLHLELAPLASDATPSRPVLYPLEWLE